MKAALLTCYQACFLLLCIISLLIIFHESPLIRWGQLNARLVTRKILLILSPQGNHKNETEYNVEPRACVIPQTEVWPRYYRETWKPISFRDVCRYESKLARVDDEQLKLVPTSSGLHGNTCFIEVTRGENDTSLTLSECFPFNSTTKLGNSSSLLITNGRSMNPEVNFALTPRVLEKLQTWKAKPVDRIPISVLIFGVDSASRAHVHRSLPKSVDAMRRMNFIDFKGYQSIEQSTLTNFMAFLMGLRRYTVRKTCSNNWTYPYDPCPLIWKNFSDANYITMYMEDGEQTFNWGGQSGFTEQPTDYYWHHLFLALDKHREGQFKTQKLPKESIKQCASSEGLGEFILQTTRRFMAKFKHVPNFTFSWLAFPFHNDMFALPAMENSMLNFLKFLKSQPTILRRTLIIFLSDHGDRFSFFSNGSSESFIERGSIPLFIRVPEALTEQYPDVLANLQANSDKFVTPFDVHHTLLHVLQEDFTAKTPLPGPPHPPDERTSLFLHLKESRICANNNIHAVNCLCNVLYNQNDSQANSVLDYDKKLKQTVLQYAVKTLNEIVKQSKYALVCKKWKTLGKDKILSVRSIGQSKGLLEFLINFSALNRAARFDIRLKVDLGKFRQGAGAAADKPFDLVGVFRVSRYGEQSWCIKKKTDADKTMKQYCICKNRKPL